MSPSTLQGGCLCGAFRWESDAAPLITRTCWCRDCQYLASGNGAVNMIMRRDGVRTAGETAHYSTRADSGNLMTRHFCPRCGTPLYVTTDARPNFMAVRVGTLDDPDAVTPVMNIWAASAPKWAPMDRSLECVAGQPPPPALAKA